MSDDRLEQLRRRRMAKAQERESAQLKEANGARVLGIMAEVLGTDFHETSAPAGYQQPELAPQIEASPGLVAAYISYPRARQIVSCCQAILGKEISASVWFDEKSYMGAFTFPQMKLPLLVDLAKKLEDRVFASPISDSSVLIIDYYPQSWTAQQTDFSVVLQGPNIESTFQDCFSQQSPLLSRILGSQFQSSK